MRQNRFFLGTWLMVIFLKRPVAAADLRGRNMFTWRPTLIFLVRAPWGNIACTCNTPHLFEIDGEIEEERRIKGFDSFPPSSPCSSYEDTLSEP